MRSRGRALVRSARSLMRHGSSHTDEGTPGGVRRSPIVPMCGGVVLVKRSERKANGFSGLMQQPKTLLIHSIQWQRLRRQAVCTFHASPGMLPYWRCGQCLRTNTKTTKCSCVQLSTYWQYAGYLTSWV